MHQQQARECLATFPTTTTPAGQAVSMKCSLLPTAAVVASLCEYDCYQPSHLLKANRPSCTRLKGSVRQPPLYTTHPDAA